MELIKGKIYRDTPEKQHNSTYLKFVERNVMGCPYFEYVSGESSHHKDLNGLIGFSSSFTHFYEPTPEELESLNLSNEE